MNKYAVTVFVKRRTAGTFTRTEEMYLNRDKMLLSHFFTSKQRLHFQHRNGESFIIINTVVIIIVSAVDR